MVPPKNHLVNLNADFIGEQSLIKRTTAEISRWRHFVSDISNCLLECKFLFDIGTILLENLVSVFCYARTSLLNQYARTNLLSNLEPEACYSRTNILKNLAPIFVAF